MRKVNKVKRKRVRLIVGAAVVIIAAVVLSFATWGLTGPNAGVLTVGRSGEVKVNGAIATSGHLIAEGTRIEAVRGVAVVLLEGDRSVVLREGGMIVVEQQGASVVLERGNARFEVTRTEGHPNPFHVSAGATQVDVLGTIFAVDRASSDDRVLVSVREGKVRVSSAQAEQYLREGEEVTSVGGRLGKIRPAALSSLKVDREARSVLDELKARTGRLFDTWSN